jgi:hypothetical protein
MNPCACWCTPIALCQYHQLSCGSNDLYGNDSTVAWPPIGCASARYSNRDYWSSIATHRCVDSETTTTTKSSNRGNRGSNVTGEPVCASLVCAHPVSHKDYWANILAVATPTDNRPSTAPTRRDDNDDERRDRARALREWRAALAESDRHRQRFRRSATATADDVLRRRTTPITQPPVVIPLPSSTAPNNLPGRDPLPTGAPAAVPASPVPQPVAPSPIIPISIPH